MRKVEWAEEPPTKRTTASMQLYQSLLSVFDNLTQPERAEFVELAAVWGGMNAEERRAVMALVVRR